MALFPGAQQGPQQQRQAPQPPNIRMPQQNIPASSSLLNYLQSGTEDAREAAGELLGGRPEANYGPSLMQFGLGMLAGDPDQGVLGNIGQAGLAAMPTFQAEQERGRQFDVRQGQLAQQVAQQDAQQRAAADQAQRQAAAQSQAAAAERAASLEDWKWKEDYKQYLEEGATPGGDDIKMFGRTMISDSAYKDSLRRGMDPKEAYQSAIVAKTDIADTEKFKTWKSFERQAAQLEAEGDLEGAQQMRGVAKEYKDFVNPPQEATTWVRDPDTGTYMPITGKAGDAGEEGTAQQLAQQFYDGERASTMNDSQMATADSLSLTGRLLDISKNSSTISQGRLGNAASMFSAWGKAAKEVMSPERRQQFEDRIGDNPNRFVADLRESEDPEVKAVANTEFLNDLERMGVENQQMLTNYIELAYAIASEKDGRVTNANVAQALRSVGMQEDALVNDPARIQAALEERSRSGLSTHYRKGRSLFGGEFDPMSDFVTKELPRSGFVMTTPGDPQTLQHVGREKAMEWWNNLSKKQQDAVEDADVEGGVQSPADAKRLESEFEAPMPPAEEQPPLGPPQGDVAPAAVSTQEQYDVLEKGARYVAPDGKVRVKR